MYNRLAYEDFDMYLSILLNETKEARGSFHKSKALEHHDALITLRALNGMICGKLD